MGVSWISLTFLFAFIAEGYAVYITPVSSTIVVRSWLNSSYPLQVLTAHVAPRESDDFKFAIVLVSGKKSICPALGIRRVDMSGIVYMKRAPDFSEIQQNSTGDHICRYVIKANFDEIWNIISKYSQYSRVESCLNVILKKELDENLMDYSACGNPLTQEHACFGRVTDADVQVLENSDVTDVASFGFPNPCEFNLTYEVLLPNNTEKGLLLLKKSKHPSFSVDVWTRAELDREQQESYKLTLVCNIKIGDVDLSSYSIPIHLTVIDEDDNPPLTRLNTTEITVYYKLNPNISNTFGIRLEPDNGHVDLTFWDQDSLFVNDFHVDVVNDTKGLIDVRISSHVNLQFVLDTPPISYVVLRTVWRNPGAVTFVGFYCVLVVVSDVSNVVVSDAKIRITICLYYEDPRNMTMGATGGSVVPLLQHMTKENHHPVTKSVALQVSLVTLSAALIVVMIIIGVVLAYKIGFFTKFPPSRNRSSVSTTKDWGKESCEQGNSINDDKDSLAEPVEHDPGVVESVKFVNEMAVYSRQPVEDPNPEPQPPFDPFWELRRSLIALTDFIGEGEFGRVFKGCVRIPKKKPRVVAVKIQKLKVDGSSAQQQDFMSEFLSLKQTKHENIIRLFGICTLADPYYLVMEFAEFGSLKGFLKKCRKLVELGGGYSSQDLAFSNAAKDYDHQTYQMLPEDVLSFAIQIAKGMAYLGGLKIIHRDLAARNVLLGTGKVCKICDFGLSRDVYLDEKYVKQSEGKVPIKWLSIESLKAGIYTTESDVWSFGILMWELSTLGKTPYPTVSPGRLCSLLESGFRMLKPEDCSDQMYNLMLKCWEAEPSKRPTFWDCELKLRCFLVELNVALAIAAVGQNSVRNPEYDYSSSQSLTTGSFGARHDSGTSRPFSFPPSSPAPSPHV